MRFGEQQLDQLASLEWLETNGLGGFASSTVVGLNTRCYHALLTAAIRPPVARIVMLSKLDETLVVGDKCFELSTNQYPGTIHPRGFVYLREFRLDPLATFVYEVEGMRLEKCVYMIYGENTTIIEYHIYSKCRERACLNSRPLIAFRDYHSLTDRNPVLNQEVGVWRNRIELHPYPDLPSLYIAHEAAAVELTGDWYYNFEYRAEHERGLDYQEDLFNPALLRFDLQTCSSLALIASTEAHSISDLDDLRRSELERRTKVRASVPVAHPWSSA